MKGGLLIREGRLRAGLTQAEVARRMDTAQSVIARWERNRRSPTMETVTKALRACGLDLAIFITSGDDGHDIGLAAQTMALSPPERLDYLLDLLEVEKLLHAARPIGAGG